MKFLNKEYLYLVWKNTTSRNRIVIGILTKNGKYTFKYVRGVKQAIKEGFSPLIAFPDIKAKYTNNVLFPVFASRIPDEKRVDIKDILFKYEMDKYDDFELLKRNGGKIPLDSLEFIDPITNIHEKNLKKDFYIAGTRYYCDENFENSINIGDNIFLEKEPTNEHDKYALKMFFKDKVIGYVPKYYSTEVTRTLNKNNKYLCYVIEKNKKCEECIKVRLILNYEK